MDLSDFEKDPRLFLFTSLTAGSSHIITATSRLETILKANKIPFQAIDIATDEKARRLWQRRARNKKLPGLVKDGLVIGDLEDVEEWNEFGELKENIGPISASNSANTGGRQGVNLRPVAPGSPPEVREHVDVPKPTTNTTASALYDSSSRIALPGAAEIAARSKSMSLPNKATEPPGDAPSLEKIASEPAENVAIVSSAEIVSKDHPSLDHLSAPASAIQSGSATPRDGTAEGSAEAVDVPAATTKHRGSEVIEAPPEEIREVESASALTEDPAEDTTERATTGVSSLTFQEPVKPQEQDAKAADDATETVAD